MKNTKPSDVLIYGQMVHEKRRAIKMTEEKLAELTDRSDKEIRNIESGASIPKLDTVIRISNALDMEIGELTPLKGIM